MPDDEAVKDQDCSNQGQWRKRSALVFFLTSSMAKALRAPNSSFSSLIPSGLDLLRRIALPPIVRLFLVTRGGLQSPESNRVRRWASNPSRGYMAMQVTLQSTIK